MVGYHVFEGDQRTDDDISYGLAFGYNLTKNWAIELDLRYTPTETDFEIGENKDIEVWTGSMNALYHFNPDGPFVPYLAAGFGGMVFEVDEGLPGQDDDEDFMLNAGAGFKLFFSEDLALRVDARYVADLHSDRNFDQEPGSDDVDHNLIAAAGLTWQFGGPPPAAPAPTDSDQDGIPDLRDKCPDTALGVAVDAVGCPPVPPKPAPVVEKPKPAPVPVPVDGDDDGDGVPNSRDKCPGTEKGVIVDEFGCPVKFTLYVEFDFDKSEIRPQYHSKLKEAAEFIKKYPGTKFLLAGHTDSKGTDQYNKALSERRAAAVKKYLVEKFGIGAQLLYPRGYGESQPIADNATEEGRQKNRRTEVICCVIIPAE
jgi:OOP family OmpA-OmpF porin